MIQFFKKTNIDFIGPRNIALTLSAIIILAGVVMTFVHGGLNFSIDFVGGTLIQVKFEKPVQNDLAKLRTIVNTLDFGSPEVRRIGALANNELQITVRKKSAGTDVQDAVKTAIATKYSENPFEVRRVEHVGPKIGGELKRNAIIASILGLLGILIYVAFRFKLPFGVASIIPLFHDALVTMAFFSIFNYEFSLTFVAAIMTILGFSINDTIVIFDRIRENTRGGLRGRKFEAVINESINQTFSRTIITSGTALLTVTALYVFGSEAIKDFALALIVGFISGIYSTVYIASPILLWWHKRWPVVK